MPWDYGDSSGIVKKWADKYGIEIEVVQVNDYIESINQFTAGAFDACTMTNMDALTIPAAGGVDTTALIVGDFSNGNDGIILKGKDKTLADIKGQKVNLVELSVSHYLLARGLDSAGMTERDLTVVNTSDADMVGIFPTTDVTAVVTWNPQLSEILEYLHLQSRTLVQSVMLPEGSSHVKLDLAQWQELLDLQAQLAEYLRKIGEPEGE